MLELASHIVETKSGHFKPEKFEDHYEDALKELLRKKQSGQKIPLGWACPVSLALFHPLKQVKQPG
jgi:non-homologous end joining protein Ku